MPTIESNHHYHHNSSDPENPQECWGTHEPEKPRLVGRTDPDMTLEEALDHLEDIQNNQATFYQDEAVKFAIAVLSALKDNG